MFIKNLQSSAILVLFAVAGLCLVNSSAIGAQNPEQLQKQFSFLGNVTTESEKGLAVTTYYLSSHAVNWTKGAGECVSSFQNGGLVSIETEEENILLNEFVGNSSGSGLTVWSSGLYDIFEEVWMWADNEESQFSDFENWCVGEPATVNGRQRVRLNFSTEDNLGQPCWESRDDFELEQFICEVTSLI